MKQTISLFFLFIAITFGTACNQGGGKAESIALSAGEYEYLTKEYSKTPDAALEKGLSKEELFKKDTKVEFKNEDANYKFTAYKITQGGTANAIFIKFEIDRLYTSLGWVREHRENKKLAIFAFLLLRLPAHFSTCLLYTSPSPRDFG